MVHDIFLRYPNGRKKAFTLSYDDGTEFDKPLVEMFNKYNVKGTFNLNSQRIINVDKGIANPSHRKRLSSKEVKELFDGTEHEIAVHTASHPSLIAIPQATVAREIIEDRNNLEKIFGRIIRGMAYPNGSWAVDDDVIKACEVSGIAYSRGSTPTHSFNLPMTGLLHYQPTCHHNDPKIFDLIEEFLNIKTKRFPSLFYVYGHSYEFDENNNWDQMEKILSKIANRDDIWYATNIEIFDYVSAFKQLKYSVDMEYVHNPTATTLWFSYDYDNIYEIKPGETIKIS